jgi:hypothetical protein
MLSKLLVLLQYVKWQTTRTGKASVILLGNKKPPSVLQHREGLGRLEALPTEKPFHWYDKAGRL